MALGYSVQQKIRDHLNGRNSRCPLCNSNSWQMLDDLVIASFFDLEYKRVIEGKVLPMVVLICDDCGYVHQISAEKLGLVG